MEHIRDTHFYTWSFSHIFSFINKCYESTKFNTHRILVPVMASRRKFLVENLKFSFSIWLSGKICVQQTTDFTLPWAHSFSLLRFAVAALSSSGELSVTKSRICWNVLPHTFDIFLLLRVPWSWPQIDTWISVILTMYFCKGFVKFCFNRHQETQKPLPWLTFCYFKFFWATRRGALLVEMGLLYDYFGNFSMWSEKYYFCVAEEHARWDWTHVR